MDSFNDFLEFNEALVEDEMDYAYFKEQYLEENSSLFDDSDNDFSDYGFDDVSF